MKKHCVAKVLLAIWETFLHENNCNYNSYGFSYKFAFILFLSFLQTNNKDLFFSKLVVCNKKYFCFFVYSESRSTSKPYRIQRRNFLNVIPVRIIVPCYETRFSHDWMFLLTSFVVITFIIEDIIRALTIK